MTGRRRFVKSVLQTAGAIALGPAADSAGRFGQGPALVVPESARPAIPYGTAAGDVTGGRAIVWSRTDRRARMIVEYATTDSFQTPRRILGPVARDTTGFTARVDLTDLPPAQRIFYRVRFEDIADSRSVSVATAGNFLTAPDRGGNVMFAWSADTAGQGWGINLDWGGMRLYETMRRMQPDFFVHCGDTIYADGPIPAEVTLDDGTSWKNVVTPAKSKVAETLDEYRGNYLYNLMDDHLRRFNAEVAQIVLWDDHEVRDNWYPSRSLERDARYTVKNMALLAARARQAFLEHVPIRVAAGSSGPIYRSFAWGPSLEVFALDLRSYRGANSPNRQTSASPATALAGARQLEWIKRRLQASIATWKVIASDQPIGLLVTDGPTDFEAIANGNGPALGRELEVADLLRFIRDRGIRNVVWLTGDVHYAAAHHYDPVRARFTEFRPFWEFVAGPLHAGTGGPNVLDDTFGPEVRFLGIPPGMKNNRPPSDGFQFFGTVRISGATGVMAVRLHNLAGDTIYSIELEPER